MAHKARFPVNECGIVLDSRSRLQQNWWTTPPSQDPRFTGDIVHNVRVPESVTDVYELFTSITDHILVVSGLKDT